MQIIITTLFGIEAVTVQELKALQFTSDQLTVTDGRIILSIDDDWNQTALAIASCNIHLATAERVLLQLGDFKAQTFDSLYDQTRSMPWEDYLPEGYAFHVNGYTRKSRLFSVPACQSLVKKAIVDRLTAVYHLPSGSLLPEDRDKGLIRIQFSIVSDQVSLMIDTSGEPLHKRGYRPLRFEAPLRETLAAAILRLAHFRPYSDEALYDPMCGSGTFPIEAALMAARIAPGLHRPFAAEQWPLIGQAVFDRVREKARSQIQRKTPDQPFIFGSDLQRRAVDIASAHARRAGVADFIRFRQANMLHLQAERLPKETGFERHLIVCNPPYGERLLDESRAEALYRGLCRNYLSCGRAKPGIRFFVLTPFDQFERLAGGPADKRRKLYNGRIKCTLYQYYRKGATEHESHHSGSRLCNPALSVDKRQAESSAADTRSPPDLLSH